MSGGYGRGSIDKIGHHIRNEGNPIAALMVIRCHVLDQGRCELEVLDFSFSMQHARAYTTHIIKLPAITQ